MTRKNAADKIKDLKEQMKKIEQQLKEEEKKRDEELGKIFREEWEIEDSKTAFFIIKSLKSDVYKLKKTFEANEDSNIQKNPDESENETKVSQVISN
jgi:ATP-dependent Lon protease